jgi:hypothetical protein
VAIPCTMSSSIVCARHSSNDVCRSCMSMLCAETGPRRQCDSNWTESRRTPPQQSPPSHRRTSETRAALFCLAFLVRSLRIDFSYFFSRCVYVACCFLYSFSRA